VTNIEGIDKTPYETLDGKKDVLYSKLMWCNKHSESDPPVHHKSYCCAGLFEKFVTYSTTKVYQKDLEDVDNWP
jgi:hypothetical protein